MNISLITFPLISLTILISGCVATVETDPQRVSWNDLFFDHRIQNHLENRKKFGWSGFATRNETMAQTIADIASPP